MNQSRSSAGDTAAYHREYSQVCSSIAGTTIAKYVSKLWSQVQSSNVCATGAV